MPRPARWGPTCAAASPTAPAESTPTDAPWLRPPPSAHRACATSITVAVAFAAAVSQSQPCQRRATVSVGQGITSVRGVLPTSSLRGVSQFGSNITALDPRASPHDAMQAVHDGWMVAASELRTISACCASPRRRVLAARCACCGAPPPSSAPSIDRRTAGGGMAASSSARGASEWGPYVSVRPSSVTCHTASAHVSSMFDPFGRAGARSP